MEPTNQPSGSVPPTPTPIATPVPMYKDRKTGLIVFGILELLLGGLCALLLPLMILGQVMAAKAGGGQMQLRMILPAMAIYAALAAMFIVLGIGSIRARRWAQAFSLILAWSWLVMGVFGLVIYSFILPRILNSMPSGSPSLPAGGKIIVMVIALAFMAVVFVVVPGALVLFFQSKHVKATCEARDPVMRWTDCCPLPVLGLSMWLLFAGVCMLLMPLAYNGVMPFFGTLLSGVTGGLYYVILAALFVYLAWATYRLNPASWWLAVGLVLFLGASNVITFARVELTDMYRLMGYPEDQIKLLQQFKVFQGSVMAWMCVAGILPPLIYLVFVKRYFRLRA